MNIETITAATDTAIPLTIAKNHLRLDGDDDDANVTTSIQAATAHVEVKTGRTITTKSYNMVLDGFDEIIPLPRPPLISVDAIKYDDVDGNEQTLAVSVYETGYINGLAYLQLAPNQSWPTLNQNAALGRVRIEYTCGYGEQDSVPENMRQAMLLLIGDFYENREAQFVGVSVNVNKTVESLLIPFRLTMGV